VYDKVTTDIRSSVKVVEKRELNNSHKDSNPPLADKKKDEKSHSTFGRERQPTEDQPGDHLVGVTRVAGLGRKGGKGPSETKNKKDLKRD